jgi:hypothetical protein
MPQVDPSLTPDKRRSDILRDGAMIVLAGLLLCAPRLWAKSLWSPDQARYAEVAREMLVSGDYLVPRVYGQPETSYPPLYYWLIVLFSLAPGRVSASSATLPSLSAALGVSLLTYAIGRVLWNRRAALYSALILTLMAGFVGAAILSRADMTLVLLEVAALFLFIRWHRNQDSGPFPLAFYGALAGATLAKGPQAPLVVGGIVLVFLGIRRELRLLRRLRLLPGLLILLALTLPWYAWVWSATRQDYFLGESLSGFAGTLVTGGHARHPTMSYIGMIFARAFPWILFLPSALALIRRDEKAGSTTQEPGGAFAFLASWMVVIVAFYSVAASKRYYYVTAVYPALALAAGQCLARGTHFGASTSTFLRLPLAVLAVLAVGSELFLDLGPDRIGSFVLSPYRSGLRVVHLAALLAAAAGLLLLARERKGPWIPAILAGLAATVHLGSMAFYEIPKNSREEESGRRFVETLRRAILPGEGIYLFQEDIPSLPLHLDMECRVLSTPEALRAAKASREPFLVAVKAWRLPEATAILGSCRVVFREAIPDGGADLILLRPDP